MMYDAKHILITLLMTLALGLATDAVAWEQIPNTRLDQVNPCPSEPCAYSGNLGFKAVVEAWNGAAVDQTGQRMFVYGGGHSDYWGNEVYELDLHKWQWRRLSEPAEPGPAFQDLDAERRGRMADGSPRVPHTYDSLVYEPTLNSLLAIGAIGTSPNSIAGHSRIERFDTGLRQWKAPLSEAQISGHWLGGTARDPATGLIWVHTSGDGQLASFNPRDDAWRYYARTALSKNFSMAAGDDHLLLLGGCVRRQCNHQRFDLSKPHIDPVSLRGLAPLAQYEGPGLAWNSRLKLFAAYANGALYHIDAEAGMYERVAKGPPSTPNGVYGRFAYVENINAYVYVAAVDQDVWIHRMPDVAPEPETPARTAAAPLAASPEPRTPPDPDDAPAPQPWSARSTAPGVQFAFAFDQPGQVYDHVLPDHPQWTNGSEHVSHSAEGMRMDILNTSTRQHGNWRHCLLPRCKGVKVGQTIYIAHSQYFDEPMITEVYRRDNSSQSTGFKQTIISQYKTSAPNGEIVLTNVGQRGYPQAYRKHRGKTAEQFGGLFHQPAVRKGPHYDDKVRLGKMPWRFRGVAYPKNGWLHFKQVVQVAGGNRAYYSLYAARPGENWTALIENGVVDLVPGFAYNGFWMLPYTSNGAADPKRSNTYTVYKDLIISLEDIAAPTVGSP